MTQPVFFPVFRAFDHSTGAPMPGALVNFYAAGTTQRQNVYTDAGLTIPWSNPVVCDANGEALIFASSALYKVVLTDSVGSVGSGWTADNLSLSGGGSGGSSSVPGHNYLINGDFATWQAGITIVGAITQVLPADGWAMRIANGIGPVTDYTISRQLANPHPGALYCMRIQRNPGSTAQQNIYLVQNIESLDAIGICGSYLACSFWARGGANLTASLGVTQAFGGTGADESWQTAGSITGQSTLLGGVGAAVTTNWAQYFAISTTPVPFGVNEISIVLNVGGFSLAAAGANDYIDFTDVQVEAGVVPTAFDRRTTDDAIRRAQRRYYKTFPQSTVPAQNAGVSGALSIPQTVGAATNMSANLWVPSWMRDSVNGTVITYNPSAPLASARNTTVGADCGAPTVLLEVGPNVSISAMQSAGGSAAGNNNRLHYTIDKRF